MVSLHHETCVHFRGRLLHCMKCYPPPSLMPFHHCSQHENCSSSKYNQPSNQTPHKAIMKTMKHNKVSTKEFNLAIRCLPQVFVRKNQSIVDDTKLFLSPAYPESKITWIYSSISTEPLLGGINIVLNLSMLTGFFGKPVLKYLKYNGEINVVAIRHSTLWALMSSPSK